MVPDRGRQRKGVRLAAAVSCIPAAIRELLAVALAAALFAALLPVELARMQPAKLVKIFADER